MPDPFWEYGLGFLDQVQLPKATVPLQRDSLLLATKSSALCFMNDFFSPKNVLFQIILDLSIFYLM